MCIIYTTTINCVTVIVGTFNLYKIEKFNISNYSI